MSELVASKSGGTSNRDAAALSQSLEWAEESDIFVVSAPGKLDGTGLADEKVTDLLLRSRASYIRYGVVLPSLPSIITERFANVVSDSGPGWGPWIDKIPTRIDEAARRGLGSAMMIGEELQAEIYQQLGYRLLHPGRTDRDLADNPEAWRSWLDEAFKPGSRHVMPGNITRVNGHLVTFARGGSDISQGLAAYGIRADRAINLTDGSFRSADPRLIPEERSKFISHLLLEEGRELGRNGTGLVHAAAMVPLEIAGIPLEVRKTFDRSAEPTILNNDQAQAAYRVGQVAALSLMENVTMHRIHEPGMAEPKARLATFENALAENNVALIDSQGDGVDGQRYFVEADDADVALAALKALPGARNIETKANVALITLVGFQLEQRRFEIYAQLAGHAALGEDWLRGGHDLSHGRHSVRFSVDAAGAKDVFSDMHRLFIEDSQPVS